MAKLRFKDRFAKLVGMRQAGDNGGSGSGKGAAEERLSVAREVQGVRAEVAAAETSSVLSGDEAKSSMSSEAQRALNTFLEPWRTSGGDSQESTPEPSPAKPQARGDPDEPPPAGRRAFDAAAGDSPPRDAVHGAAVATAAALHHATELDRRGIARQRNMQQLSRVNGTAMAAGSAELAHAPGTAHALDSHSVAASQGYGSSMSGGAAHGVTSPPSSHNGSIAATRPFMLTGAGRAGLMPRRDSAGSAGSGNMLHRDSTGSAAGVGLESVTRHTSLHSNGSTSTSGRGELEGLVAALSEGSAEQRGAAAERLFNRTAEDESMRLRAASLSPMPPLVRLLHDGRERGKMYAAYALSAIVSPSTPLSELRAAGTIPALIHLLNTSKVLASKKGAMRALGRLARSADAALEIVAAGGLPPIVALLDCNDPALVRRCLIALYFIGADREALQLEITQAGAVPGAVRLCAAPHAEVQAEAADLLKVLARNPRAAAVTVDAGGLEALGAVAGRGLSHRAKEGAIKALQRLAHAPGLKEVVMGSGAAMFLHTQASSSERSEVAQLADLMTGGHGTDQQTAAAAVIEDVAAAEPDVARDLAGAGVVEPLVEMLAAEAGKGQIYACRALAQMATDPLVRAKIMGAGAIPLLVALLQARSVASAAAAATVERLATHSGAAAAVVQAQGVESLVGLLISGGPECSCPVCSALLCLLPCEASVPDRIVDAGGLDVLVQKSCRSASEVRVAMLTLLNGVLQSTAAELTPGALARLAALEYSTSDDVCSHASAVLNTAANNGCASAVKAARRLQANVGQLLSRIREVVAFPAPLEEALRLIPRSTFLPLSSSDEAWRCQSVMVSDAGVIMGNPQVEALALAALLPSAGHTFLDVGSGTGYLTLLAAHLVGENGKAVGVEVVESAVKYATGRLTALRHSYGLASLPLTFVQGSVFGEATAMLGRFDRIHVGGNCPKARLRDLLRLLKPGGKVAVPCERQLLLLTQPASGPVPEPIVLGTIPACDSLVIEDIVQGPRTPNPDASHLQQLSTSPMNGSAHSGGRSPAGTSTVPSPQWAAMPSSDAPVLPPKAALSGRSGGSGSRLSGALHNSAHNSTDSGQGSAYGGVEPRDEADSGWFISRNDIRICRNAEGRKCRLGEGGFGIVYKAMMSGCDEVAVKLVKADKPSPKEMALFHKEVKVLRQLHHRNIVQFYGACLEPGSMFFVTELMKGGDLYSALRNHPETMRWDRLGRKVAVDVALGINYLHTRRPPLMHRDLKSPNVLLSAEGVAKIADVGMVRDQVQELVTAQPVMTPLWAAPEVIRHERASIKADIWSYGILIWELISGADITEHQPLAVSRQIQGSSGKTLELPGTCPPVAAKIFKECTQMDPEARPTTQQIVEWLRS